MTQKQAFTSEARSKRCDENAVNSFLENIVAIRLFLHRWLPIQTVSASKEYWKLRLNLASCGCPSSRIFLCTTVLDWSGRYNANTTTCTEMVDAVCGVVQVVDLITKYQDHYGNGLVFVILSFELQDALDSKILIRGRHSLTFKYDKTMKHGIFKE
mmetsp:Transcript_12299/g.16105  ORF Transcript_12299/g.16105 Transcript_12299/m.16105 type:complete len:156 (-) Transcript_12299:852-1319(-)